MRLLLLRIGVVLVLGLVVFLALTSLGSRGAARYAAAQKRAGDTCRAFRDQPSHANAEVCRFDEFSRPKTFEQYKAAESKLGAVRGAIAGQDPAGAGHLLLEVTASARRWDEHGTVVTAVFASRMIDRVLDLLQTYGDALDPRTRREILTSARLEIASHPFERERLHHLWQLAHYREIQWPGEPPLSDTELADQMDRADAAFVEMENATLVGDVKRCERAARTLGQPGARDFMVLTCPRFADAVRVGKRLDAM